MKNYKLLFPIFLFGFTMVSCVKDTVKVDSYHYSDEQWKVISENLNLPESPHEYDVQLPQHVASSGASAAAVNDDKATLGRVLFYDTRLSQTQSVSCASCHDQSIAFSDDVAFSEGFDGQLTKRNSLALGAVVSFSATYQGGNDQSFLSNNGARFFWDERAGSVEEQSALTIEDDIEMGMKIADVKKRLEGIDYYEALFNAAYGNDGITEENILDAISEFINAMGSFNSKFDKEAAPFGFSATFNDFPGFTEQENKGKQLYMDNCASCHGQTFSSPNVLVSNNGLDEVYEDKGVGAITGRSDQMGMFKVPPLRNIELTGPYMHDGRFETLEEVIEHYSSGIKNHRNLGPQLTEIDHSAGTRIAKPMNFNGEEKASLVAFLKTLTDNEFITAERFSDPFK
jgi:cytochrome c peroxidase